jgi:hypothetical protein
MMFNDPPCGSGGFAVPEKDEGPGAINTEALNSTPDKHYFASAPSTDKALDNITAALALKGYALHRMADGLLLIERWGYSRTVDGITQAAQFLIQIGGRP